jgi:hypothetical protein
MSYTALSIIVSLIYGFFGMLFFVFANADKENANRIVWGSFVFWACLVLLAQLTTGWISALASLIGGSLIFAIEADTLASICFTYGRVLLQLANHHLLSQTVLAPPLCYVGNQLQDWRAKLVGRSLLAWLVQCAARIWFRPKRRKS